MGIDPLRPLLFGIACIVLAGIAGISQAEGIRKAPPADSFDSAPPNYDAAAAYPQGLPPAERAPLAPAALSALIKPGTQIRRDERFGTPTFLWAAKGHPYAAAGAKAGSRRPEEDAARFHVRRFAAAYDMQDADVDTVLVRSIHNTGKGPIIVKLKQAIGGVEVFRDEMNVAMDRNFDLISISGFLPGAQGRAGSARLSGFSVGPSQAIAIAARDLTGQEVAAGAAGSSGGYDLYALSPAPSSNLVATEATRVKRVWFHLPDRLEAGYYVELYLARTGNRDFYHFGYVISADNGAVLFRNNYTRSDSYSYRVWAETAGLHAPFDGPQGTTPTPHPTGTPNGFQPLFILPNLVTLQNGPISTNDPWLPPGATQTIGNNVEAFADLDGNDGFNPNSADFHASTNGANTFDRTYDTTAQPQSSQDQQMAAITQLFYNVNFFHDWYYDFGFDEAAGNAQTSNFGRGGLEGDSIFAEAQDFSGRNNANMSTPPDGSRPRMRMYIFAGNAARDVIVNSPVSGGGPFGAGSAAFGPQAFGVTGNLVLANPTTACTAPLNAASLNGNVALVDRGGGCSFSQKADTVRAAGANGLIVVNNLASGVTGGGTLFMSSTVGFNDNIATLGLSLEDGATLKGDLGGGTVNVTLNRPQPLDRDGTIDNQIIAHEWGHYISNRLISDANGLTTNMAGGLGEGWADFHSMLLTVRPEDALVASNANFSGVYALAGYTSGGLNPDGTPNQGWYFGLRRVPYSTDLTKNALTFKHISDGIALPAGVPTAFGADGASNSEVHSTGEVWATMLWECYAGLLRDTLGASPRLTFDQARDRMKTYLVAAYKLTPVNPTLVEARDALLAAAAADPADLERFERAFARRGAGFGAIAPDRNSANNSPVTESFVETTSTTLGSSANPSVLGQSVTLTATVSGATPTGSITFKDGATTLGAGALNGAGVAALSTAALALGGHSITAQYQGDANFSPSMSATLNLTVNSPPPPDFSVSASPTSLTIAAGQSGSVTFTVTPLNGFAQTVSFSCGSLPALASCTFAPASVTPDGTHAASSTLTIGTAARSASAVGPTAKRAGPFAQLAGLGALSLFSFGMLALRGPRRRASWWMPCLGLALALVACGGGGRGGGGSGSPVPTVTPPGTYSISIAGMAGAANKSVAVSVTVQ